MFLYFRRISMCFRGFLVYVEVFLLAIVGAFHIALFGVFEVFSLVFLL